MSGQKIRFNAHQSRLFRAMAERAIFSAPAPAMTCGDCCWQVEEHRFCNVGPKNLYLVSLCRILGRVKVGREDLACSVFAERRG